METKTITLAGNQVAIVDADDLAMLSGYKWKINNGYPSCLVRQNGKYVRLYMHRMVLGEKAGACTDHKNGNKLDNRKSNLRPCTLSQNRMNTGLRKDNKTGCKGVYWSKSRNKFHASIRANGKSTFLGLFDTMEKAKAVRQAAAIRLHGEYAQ